jgi:hypothetical protein
VGEGWRHGSATIRHRRAERPFFCHGNPASDEQIQANVA